jgi:Cu(I)/Ag(I) efflux system membrane protein CusA/SilA
VLGYVARASERLNQTVKYPPGYYSEWAGQFQSFERARAQLLVVVPLTLALVALLLYLNTGSAVETGLILGLVPFSLIGAVWLLYLLGYNLSVAVWVGVIALAGLDAQNGVVMLLYLKLVHAKREAEGRMRNFADLTEAVVEGAADRIRPKLMTVLTMIGFCSMSAQGRSSRAHDSSSASIATSSRRSSSRPSVIRAMSRICVTSVSVFDVPRLTPAISSC